MKRNIDEYIGKKFGQLTVIGQEPGAHFNSNKWVFLCDCGKTLIERPSRILSGHSKSCGCMKGKSSLTHGCNGDEFYPTWWGMMRRCYNENAHNFERYGGRGITVCDDWHDPSKFIEWARSTIGNKTPNLSLDRKDNSKGYSPENCVWSTPITQANNRRSNVLETINGETKTVAEWCRIYCILPETVRERQRKGTTFDEAVSAPVKDSKFKTKKKDQ